MFSPSLITIMLHTIDREALGASRLTTFASTKEIANELDAISRQWNTAYKTVPVVGRNRQPFEIVQEHFAAAEPIPSDIAFDRIGEFAMFWGRIPLDRLIAYFVRYCDQDPSIEYLDLGTPMFKLGSGSTYDQICKVQMSQTAQLAAATVGAAIVDMGENDIGCHPDDYGGMLRHVVTKDIKMSDHAEKVLSVLLERLKKNSGLNHTAISCSLVRPPTAFVGTGLSAFDQACSPEILTAVQALGVTLSTDNLPACVNFSLGTHVGPHNGDSPLEEYIRTISSKQDLYVVAAAGNEGGAGHAARCTLEGSEPEFLTIRTGPLCEQLLVEFWWDDLVTLDLAIDVDVWETTVSPSGTRRTNHGSLRIDRNTIGTLSVAPAGLPRSMIMHSLFGSRCKGNFSCVAFAISGKNGSQLPSLEVDLKLQATALPANQKAFVNGWIVVAESDPLTASTAFIEGGAEGSMMVPASDPTVLSVAGLDNSGNIWKGSSRGPAAVYDTTSMMKPSPLMAHVSYLGSDVGTSFASPRACADAIATLADPNKRTQCRDALSLLIETYGLHNLPSWNARFGYHKAQ